MTEWSAIIYSRTYEVDFRFLALPIDFEADDQKWAKEHINQTIENPESLRNYSNWLICSNNKYCIVGVACRLRQLTETIENTTDRNDRDSYLFVGYVAQLKNTLTYLPKYLGKDIKSLFQPLNNTIQEIINKQWFVKTYEITRNNCESLPYSYNLENLVSQKEAISNCENIFVNLLREKYDFKLLEITKLVKKAIDKDNVDKTKTWQFFCEFLLFSQEKLSISNITLSLYISGSNKKPILEITPLLSETHNSQMNTQNSPIKSNKPDKHLSFLAKLSSQNHIKRDPKIKRKRIAIVLVIVGIIILVISCILFKNKSIEYPGLLIGLCIGFVPLISGIVILT